MEQQVNKEINKLKINQIKTKLMEVLKKHSGNNR